MPQTAYRLKHWTYHPSSGRLKAEGAETELTGLTARTLDVLIAHAPHPVSLETFARDAWRQPHLSEDTLAQRIAQLRKALGDNPRDPEFIRTLRGEGYALIAPVEPLAAQGLLQNDRSPTGAGLPIELKLVGGVLIAAILGLGLNAMLNTPATAPTPERAETRAPLSPVDAMLSRAGAMIALQDEDGTRRAITLLEEARLLAPDDPRVAVLLAFALSTDATKYGGDRIAEAEALARSALEREPENARAWNALGYALDAQSRTDEALAAYGQSLSYDPNNGAALSSMAYLLSIQGRLYEALSQDVQALGLGRGGVYTELQIATVLRLLGDDERARRFEARALLLNPDQPVVLAGLARSALARGETAAAAELLTRLPTARRTADMERLLGRLALLDGARETAIAHFQSAGEDALYERIALGIETAEIKDKGPWPEQHVRLAEVSASRGAFDQALEELNAAINLGWRDAGALRHSPFLAPLVESGRLEPVFTRIQQQIAAQADRLNRDEVLAQNLDAVLDVQP